MACVGVTFEMSIWNEVQQVAGQYLKIPKLSLMISAKDERNPHLVSHTTAAVQKYPPAAPR